MIKTLPPDKFEQNEFALVEMDSSKILHPSKDRFKAKKEVLAKKAVRAQVHISGGCLAQLNNEAFPRCPSLTACYLVGAEEENGSFIKGMFVPNWDVQEKMNEWSLPNKGLQDFCENSNLALLGICLVCPEDEEPDAARFSVVQTFQESCTSPPILVLTCKDRKSAFYKKQSDILQPLRAEVYWVGPNSYYFAHIQAHVLSHVEMVKEAGRSALVSRGSGLRTKRAMKDAQNEARKAKRQCQDSKGTHEGHLKHIIEELQSVADFLVQRLAEFALDPNDKVREDYSATLDRYPLGEAGD